MQFFKHMGNMRHDRKVRRVIRRFGLEGYGLYNLILESIVEGMDSKNPLPDLEDTLEDIAEDYNGNTAKLTEIVLFMINQGLFHEDEVTGRLVCHKIYKFLDERFTRSQEIKNMIAAYKKAAPEAVLRLSEDSRRNSIVEENRLEHSREEAPQTARTLSIPDSNTNVFEVSRIHWNSKDNLPTYRRQQVNVPIETLRQVMMAMDDYTEAEIKAAIDNYARLRLEDRGPSYSAFPNFLTKGLEKFADDANPDTLFPEDGKTADERAQAEAWKREQEMADA